MAKWVIVSALLLSQVSLAASTDQTAAMKLNAIFDVSQKTVYVAAHRGDWRDAPENSIRALQASITMGVDIVELDLKKTRDGHLVVMHDQSLDRSTTGTGKVSDYTLAELEGLWLRAGTGHRTSHRIPTFPEELSAAKGKMVLDIDQGWDFFPDVIREVREVGMLPQVIVNVRPNQSFEDFTKEYGPISDDVTIMIVVSMERVDAIPIIQSYRAHKRTIIQCIFADETNPAVVAIPDYRKRSPVWINSLWPNQNAMHDDDRAVEENHPNETWGWLVKNRASILQTDRPKEMLEYLRSKGLHQ